MKANLMRFLPAFGLMAAPSVAAAAVAAGSMKKYKTYKFTPPPKTKHAVVKKGMSPMDVARIEAAQAKRERKNAKRLRDMG